MFIMETENAMDHFILNVGTNDLSSDKSSEERTVSIIDLATSIKNENLTS